MPKKSVDEVSARKFMILERICADKDGASLSALARSLPRDYKVDEGTIKKDVNDLCHKLPIITIKNGKVYAIPTTLEEMWSGTPIGDRLVPSESKVRLAKVVFSFIERHKGQIGRLILGTGTTVYECARELIKGAPLLRSRRIHTANLLVIKEFLWHKPDNLYIELPGGEIDLDTASLWNRDIAKYFKSIEAQIVITSFSDMSFEKGFCTAYHDVEEKLADLKPNPQTCKWIVIPIEWRKVAHAANIPVAGSREEQLELIKGKRKYIIITDKPSEAKWNKDVDDPKLEDLQKWQEAYPDDVEIIYA